VDVGYLGQEQFIYSDIDRSSRGSQILHPDLNAGRRGGPFRCHDTPNTFSRDSSRGWGGTWNDSALSS
jgi:hypothetical protein